jgi:tRNA dimethylallyltransferase
VGVSTHVIAVVGATATGKSSLGTALAEALSGEIVNADSMQLYRGMDIGTAKEPEAARRGVPHHLLDIWPVTRTANVADYQKLARTAIDGIIARGRVPVLVGGSGLYIRAAIDDLDFPRTDGGTRARLESELAELGPAALHARLARLDPAAAAAILPGNGRRIVRALEVIEITGRPFTATMPPYQAALPAVQIGLALPRPELDDRIAARVDRMWQSGFEAEVRALIRVGLRDGKTAGRALGYQQMLRHLDGELTLEAAREETIRATRRFARRQESWFRRDPRVTWLDAAKSPLDEALRHVQMAARALPGRLRRPFRSGAPGGQIPGLPRQRAGDEQAREQIRLEGQRPEADGDADLVVGPVHDLQSVAGADLADLDHPQVRAGTGRLGELLDPAGLLQPALERSAGNPGTAHLEDHVRPDPPAFPDQRTAHV